MGGVGGVSGREGEDSDDGEDGEDTRDRRGKGGKPVEVVIPCEPVRLLPRLVALCSPTATRRTAKLLSLSPLLARIDGFLDQKKCQRLVQVRADSRCVLWRVERLEHAT